MLTQAVADAASSVPPSEWLYIIAALATIVCTFFGARAGLNKYIGQRQKEAVDKADLQRAILGNVEATRENTVALTKMATDFHDFALETRAALNGHAERLGHLERPEK